MKGETMNRRQQRERDCRAASMADLVYWQEACLERICSERNPMVRSSFRDQLDQVTAEMAKRNAQAKAGAA
jgi:hypothetical protein